MGGGKPVRSSVTLENNAWAASGDWMDIILGMDRMVHDSDIK